MTHEPYKVLKKVKGKLTIGKFKSVPSRWKNLNQNPGGRHSSYSGAAGNNFSNSFQLTKIYEWFFLGPCDRLNGRRSVFFCLFSGEIVGNWCGFVVCVLWDIVFYCVFYCVYLCVSVFISVSLCYCGHHVKLCVCVCLCVLCYCVLCVFVFDWLAFIKQSHPFIEFNLNIFETLVYDDMLTDETAVIRNLPGVYNYYHIMQEH